MTEREMLFKVCQFLQAPPSAGECITVNFKAWNSLLQEVHEKLYGEIK